MANDVDPGALFAAYVLDLRAQFEAELRTLTNIQRELEVHRAADLPEQRRAAADLMQRHFQELIAANVTIRQSLLEASSSIERLQNPGDEAQERDAGTDEA